MLRLMVDSYFGWILDTPSMREMSVAEQRYQAVLAVIGDGRTVKDVAAQFGISRQSLHGWLRRYEDQGLEGLTNRSHRPASCPHQMPAAVEAVVLELRRSQRGTGVRGGSRSRSRRQLVALARCRRSRRSTGAWFGPG